MKRKLLAAAALTAGVLLIAGCAKRETGNGVTAWGDEKASEVPVTERVRSVPSDTAEEKNTATETDSGSVEIKMQEGGYQTFFVEDDSVREVLNQKGGGSEITFTYGAVEGQINRKIIKIE